ncbi:MAG TPA: hypothetical protein VGS16_13100 [Candidatus Dormibacteraeota bacterium]|nr:hypothetical protein [Candidatus Dormibacteraeota bacterium]
MSEDMDGPEGLSRRARRAMPLIAAALTAIVVAGVIYLHPSVPASPPKPAPKVIRPLLLSNQYSATYDFVSPSAGWALVLGRASVPVQFSVYRTSDSAKHWSKQLTGHSPALGLGWIKFFDRAHGVITIGSPGVLYRTQDAGAHWELRQLPPYAPTSMTFSDPLHGWLIGVSDPSSGYVRHFFATVDGGATWRELVLPAWALGGGRVGIEGELQFRRSADGWLGAGADRPTAYSTIDGGASWQPHLLPNPAPPSVQTGGKPLPPAVPGYAFITSVSLLPQVGVIAIFDFYYGQGVAYSSFDGGSSWRSLAPPPGETTYSDFEYQDSFHWWAMRFGSLWKTSDAGQSWNMVSQQTDDWDYRPQVVDSKHAWALLVSSPGTLVPGAGLAMTADGGLHWKQVDAPQPG